MLFTDISSERVVKAFSKIGFRIIKQGKHTGMSDGTRHLTIPRHTRINPYTLRAIIRAAGLTDEEFRKLI